MVDLGGPARASRVTALGVARRVPRLAVADRVLVGVRPGMVTPQAISRSMQLLRARVTRTIGGQLLVVDLPPGSDLRAAARSLATQSGVAFAEPDWAVYPTKVPTDPGYVQQWHLPKIQAPKAWDISTGSATVVIAVIDSGIDLSNPDLAPQIWNNPHPGKSGHPNDVHGWNFWDGNNNVQAIPTGKDLDGDGIPDENVDHGTLVAGTAAAAANGWGCVGVAWNVTIMPLKVLPSDGSTYVSTVVDAMTYASQNGANIMNLSLGSPYDESFTAPIVQMWNTGGLTVCAGGNDGVEITDDTSTWNSPTCNQGPNQGDNMVLGVGGLDQNDRKASWSDYDGSTAKHFIEVFAPGMGIYGDAVYYPSVGGFSTYFTSDSGTSFSSPMVAGLAALLKAQSPSRTGADLIRIIRAACDNVDGQNPGYAGLLGSGRINCARALGAVLPPNPPTNVAAADTPADFGGSITVTWTKSSDDGGGANSVTGYIVSRATGSLPTTDSGWTDIKTVAKGATSYADTTTTDGINYYYRVGATDGANRSESPGVGPVQSVDDLAPAAVTTLIAADHPLDHGGAIDLAWSGYVSAADVVGFHLYRATSAFTTTAGMTPLVTLANPTARAYTDSTTTDGVDYWYAVAAYNKAGRERQNVTAAGPVQSFANSAVTFPAGQRMLATPTVPADQDPATLFGIAAASLRYDRYDPVAGKYQAYAGKPLSDVLRLGLGRGFWVMFSGTVTVTATGSTAPSGGFTIPVVAGWQQLGNPFFSEVDFSSASVTYGGTTMDLPSAEAAGIMRSYAWVYNTTTKDYDLIQPDFGVSKYVQPWEGFWVLASKACSLTLPPPVGARGVRAAAVRARALSASAGQWPVQLVLRSAGGVAAGNWCGVCSARGPILAPPPAANRAELFFDPPAGSPPGHYATAFSPVAQPRMSWDLKIAWSSPQGRVVLSWPDLSHVPAAYTLTLCDLGTGARVSMRRQASYALDAGSSAGVRSLRVEAVRAGAGAATITALSVTGAAATTRVGFTLSAPATCDVQVVNAAGKLVRTLATGRAVAAGANVWVWDQRNASGARVPSGLYVVRLTAHGADGSMTSALRSLRVER